MYGDKKDIACGIHKLDNKKCAKNAPHRDLYHEEGVTRSKDS